MHHPYDSFLSLNSACVWLKINFKCLYDCKEMPNYVKYHNYSNMIFKGEVGKGGVVL